MPAIEMTRKVDATQALLWTYLSTSSGLSCWQADTVEGSLESGNFSLRWPELGARLDLSVSEVERGSRLVLRAGQNSLELCASAGEVRLTHQGLDESDDLEGFTSSWCTALALLELAATRHPKSTRKVTWFFEQIEGGAELAHCFFTDPSALSSWLGTSNKPLVTGENYKLELFGNMSLSGTVLYAKRDVCLRVAELDSGALTLRTLPGPEGKRIIALGISTWNAPPGDELVNSLKGALYRLAQRMVSKSC